MFLRTDLIANAVATTQGVGLAPNGLGGADAALLELADAGLDSRVVVLAPGALELTCALLRQGYAEVTLARLTDRPRHGSADVVIMPQVASAESLGRVIAFAHRMLAPLGTLAMGFAAGSADELPQQARRLLASHGFAVARTRMTLGATLLRAERPSVGALLCA